MEVRIIDAPANRPNQYRSLIATRVGAVLDEQQLDRDIRALYRTRQFAAVDVRVTQVSPREVDVCFELRAKFRIESVRVTGNEKVSTRDLESEIPIVPDEPLDEAWIAMIAEHLQFFLAARGFPDAAVSWHIDQNAVTHKATVSFEIREQG